MLPVLMNITLVALVHLEVPLHRLHHLLVAHHQAPLALVAPHLHHLLVALALLAQVALVEV